MLDSVFWLHLVPEECHFFTCLFCWTHFIFVRFELKTGCGFLMRYLRKINITSVWPHEQISSSLCCTNLSVDLLSVFFWTKKPFLQGQKCVFKASEKLPSYPLLLFYCEDQWRDALGRLFIGNELKWDSVLKGHSEVLKINLTRKKSAK